MRDALDVLQLEAIFLLYIGIFHMINRRKEHILRANPQRTIAVKLAIDHVFLIGFGVMRHVLHQVHVTLKMAVDAFDLQFLSHNVPFAL